MDTSQAHLSSKGSTKDTAKAETLSKDELHAVLKYGAQKMCVICVHALYLVALIHRLPEQLRQR